MKIGIDIEENSRFILEKNSLFLKQNFSKEEIDYAYLKTESHIHLAACFCAKEALIKTLEDDEKISNIDIYLTHRKNGKPEIFIKSGKLKNLYKFEVSISHTKDYSTAIVLKKENE